MDAKANRILGSRTGTAATQVIAGVVHGQTPAPDAGAITDIRL